MSQPWKGSRRKEEEKAIHMSFKQPKPRTSLRRKQEGRRKKRTINNVIKTNLDRKQEGRRKKRAINMPHEPNLGSRGAEHEALQALITRVGFDGWQVL